MGSLNKRFRVAPTSIAMCVWHVRRRDADEWKKKNRYRTVLTPNILIRQRRMYYTYITLIYTGWLEDCEFHTISLKFEIRGGGVERAFGESPCICIIFNVPGWNTMAVRYYWELSSCGRAYRGERDNRATTCGLVRRRRLRFCRTRIMPTIYKRRGNNARVITYNSAYGIIVYYCFVRNGITYKY